MIKLIKSTFFNESDTKEQLSRFVKKADWLSFGKECQKFESQFAKYQGRKYCTFVNSGSSANLSIIQALINLGKLKRGDKVGFSSVTWSTNTMPLIQLGLIPVAIDVELDTLNISSSKLSEILKEHKLKALFLTNLLGFCDDIDKIAKICKSKNIILIEDNCESLGTVYKKKKLGNFGLASTFSFYVGHHMSTVEGGAVCTDNEKLSEMLNIVRAHGWDRNLNADSQNKLRNKHKVNSTFYSRYTFYDLGYNLRPTEIQGYLGQNQLKYIKRIVSTRNKNFMKFAKSIYKNTDKYFPIKFDHINFVSNFAVPVICKSVAIRDALVQKCNDIVEIRPVVGGDMTRQPFFKKHILNAGASKNPNARIIHDQGLYFGNNPELTDAEIDTIIKIFST